MGGDRKWVAVVLAALFIAGLAVDRAEGRARRLLQEEPEQIAEDAERDADADREMERDDDRRFPGRRTRDEAMEQEREARRRRVNEDDWFRDRAIRESYEQRGDFPSGEMHDFVIANARAATARMMFRRAESALAAAVRKAKRTFEASEELKEALAAEREAYAEYQRARREALAAVVADPRYQAILSLHQDLGEQIVAHRREITGDSAPDTRLIADPGNRNGTGVIFNTAMLRLHVATDAREMEREAIEASDDLRAARERLTTAAQRITELRHEFDQSIREDEDLAAARQVLEDARIARVTAAAYLRGSRLAAREALDFAYYLHRYDDNIYFDPYYSYGYGARYARGVRY